MKITLVENTNYYKYRNPRNRSEVNKTRHTNSYKNMKTTIISLATILVAVCNATTPPPVTGNTPPAVRCPNTLCKAKADGNYEYADPSTYIVNNYFLQCQLGLTSNSAINVTSASTRLMLNASPRRHGNQPPPPHTRT